MGKIALAKIPGSEAAIEVRFGAAIQVVDDLISPPPTQDYIAPGFIDLQVNGFAGVDYNDPASSTHRIAKSVRVMFTTGVTRCLPTIITGAFERMSASLHNLARAKAELNGAESEAIAGFHIEGPHISPEDGPRGAHPLEHVRPPDVDEFDRLQEAAGGDIKLVTISPEWDAAPAYIRHIVRGGVVASIGHTKASARQIAAAVDAGATMSTHVGNASHAVLPKTDNYIWDQLADERLGAGLIVDGIHIPSHFLQAVLRAKGLDRCFLVTDAVMPAMCDPGQYKLGSVDVELKPEGKVVLRGGDRLAGSALRMDRAIGNAVRLGGITLTQALVLATINPARLGRIGGRQRGLVPGDKADLVVFRWDPRRAELNVRQTIVAGETVFADEAN